jgi:hypothetical protein
MENYLSLSPNNGALRVTIESMSVIPGLGRHRLQILSKLSGEERTDGATVTFTGDVSVEGLGGANGYLGTILPTTPQRISRDGSFQIVFYVELTDDQVHMIESRRTRGDGGFDLRLNVRASARYLDGTRGEGSNQFQPQKFSREDWLNVLHQLGYRKVMIAELDVPDAGSKPELAKALAYFSQAQGHFGAGEYRVTVESLRQCLNVLVGKSPDEESDAEQVTTDLKAVMNSVRSGERITYQGRMELVRSAMKFMADLGGHPEVDESNRSAAEAQLHMVAGLLYWFNHY